MAQSVSYWQLDIWYLAKALSPTNRYRLKVSLNTVNLLYSRQLHSLGSNWNIFKCLIANGIHQGQRVKNIFWWVIVTTTGSHIFTSEESQKGHPKFSFFLCLSVTIKRKKPQITVITFNIWHKIWLNVRATCDLWKKFWKSLQAFKLTVNLKNIIIHLYSNKKMVFYSTLPLCVPCFVLLNMMKCLTVFYVFLKNCASFRNIHIKYTSLLKRK